MGEQGDVEGEWLERGICVCVLSILQLKKYILLMADDVGGHQGHPGAPRNNSIVKYTCSPIDIFKHTHTQNVQVTRIILSDIFLWHRDPQFNELRNQKLKYRFIKFSHSNLEWRK